MRRLVHEIFKEFAQATDREARIAVVRKYGHPRGSNFQQEFQDVLQGAFHPGISWVFKERFPYRPSGGPLSMGVARIASETNKFYIWVENSKKVNPNLTFRRKLQLATQLLEALDRGEADVIMSMFMKDLNEANLTYDLVDEALPGLLPPTEEKVERAASIVPMIVAQVPETAPKLSRRQRKKLKKAETAEESEDALQAQV